MLELLPFAKLGAGGRGARRYQVLSRALRRRSADMRRPSTLRYCQRLLGSLAAHRASWNSQPSSFTVDLSIATLEKECAPSRRRWPR